MGALWPSFSTGVIRFHPLRENYLLRRFRPNLSRFARSSPSSLFGMRARPQTSLMYIYVRLQRHDSLSLPLRLRRLSLVGFPSEPLFMWPRNMSHEGPPESDSGE